MILSFEFYDLISYFLIDLKKSYTYSIIVFFLIFYQTLTFAGGSYFLGAQWALASEWRNFLLWSMVPKVVILDINSVCLCAK